MLHGAKSWLSSNLQPFFKGSFPLWVGCPQPAVGRAVSHNRHLAKDYMMFSKLHFADQTPCVLPLPVVSPNCYHCPRDIALGQCKPPLPSGYTGIEDYERRGLTGYCDYSLPLETAICRRRPGRSFHSDIRTVAGREILSRKGSERQQAMPCVHQLLDVGVSQTVLIRGRGHLIPM